ncbi:MAG: sigma-54 dependent transcriptional regulator [Candidatus Binatia bacterium]
MSRVLVVDDDAVSCQMLAEVLQGDGVQVVWETEPAAALAAARRLPIDLAILDLRMPQMSGLALMEALRAETPGLPVMIMTGFGSMDSAVEALNSGAVDYVSKPMNVEEIRAAVRRALSRPADAAPPPGAIEPAAGMVGRTPAMVEVYTTIARVAPSLSTVLVLGESGTGKELAARAIHRHSPRREGPFVAVDCTALTESLLESELFGHVRGAFTGAVHDAPGLFQEANGGTIFLDEIGDIGLPLQAAAARAAGAAGAAGGRHAVQPVDVRVVAATNRDLLAAVAAGQFREDLYYRLNVVALHLPPLRERRDDIRLLVDHLVQRAAAQCGKPVAGVSAAALDLLSAHDWPGNVRELAHVLEPRRGTGARVGDRRRRSAAGAARRPRAHRQRPRRGPADAGGAQAPLHPAGRRAARRQRQPRRGAGHRAPLPVPHAATASRTAAPRSDRRASPPGPSGLAGGTLGPIPGRYRAPPTPLAAARHRWRGGCTGAATDRGGDGHGERRGNPRPCWFNSWAWPRISSTRCSRSTWRWRRATRSGCRFRSTGCATCAATRTCCGRSATPCSTSFVAPTRSTSAPACGPVTAPWCGSAA